jgi:hypothetical protein
LYLYRVRAEIDPHTERVFHKSQVFIAGPEKGLKVGRNLQSELQTASKAAAGKVRSGL